MTKANAPLTLVSKAALAALLSLLFASCSSFENLQQVTHNKATQSGASKNAGSQEIPAPKGDESDGADDSVTPPTSVGGAFLTCDVTDKAPAKQGQIGVGCLLKIEDKKAVVTSAPKFAVSAPNPINVSYIDSTDPAWHWFVYVATNINISQLVVHVEVETDKGRVEIEFKPAPGSTSGHQMAPDFFINGYNDGALPSEVTPAFYDPVNPLRIQLLPEASVLLNAGITPADIDGVMTYIHLLEGAKGETICSYRFDAAKSKFMFLSCSGGRPYSDWFDVTKLDVRCERANAFGKHYQFQLPAPQASAFGPVR